MKKLITFITNYPVNRTQVLIFSAMGITGTLLAIIAIQQSHHYYLVSVIENMQEQINLLLSESKKLKEVYAELASVKQELVDLKSSSLYGNLTAGDVQVIKAETARKQFYVNTILLVLGLGTVGVVSYCALSAVGLPVFTLKGLLPNYAILLGQKFGYFESGKEVFMKSRNDSQWKLEFIDGGKDFGFFVKPPGGTEYIDIINNLPINYLMSLSNEKLEYLCLLSCQL